jgi:hypothetical protein
MKTKLFLLASLITAVVVYFGMPSDQAAAQPSESQAAGTPPIGRLVEVTLVAWPISSQPAAKVTGNLLAMMDDWIIVKEGSYEHWVPKEKILDMKVSR